MLFVALLMSVLNSFKVFRELYMLFGRYPSPYIYTLQHYMNNQFANLNMQKLSAASHLLFAVMSVFILLIYFFQTRFFDAFGDVNSVGNKMHIEKKRGRTGYVVVIIAVVLAALPLLFTASNSLMSSGEIVSRYSEQVLAKSSGELSRNGLHFVRMGLVPDTLSLQQYRILLTQSPALLRLFWNSVVLIVPILIGQFLVSLLGGYAFERISWKHKEAVFGIYLVIMLMPMQVLLVPHYIIADALGIVNSYWAIILPAIFNPIGVFLIRLQLKGFPRGCIEAAQLCGATEWQIFRRIVLPNLKAAAAILLIFTFAEYWNIIDQSIVFLNDAYDEPLSVYLSRMLESDSGLVSAASCIYMVPALLVFLMGKDALIGFRVQPDIQTEAL